MPLISLFKRLAHNDTGAAAGHQSGILIPKDLSGFFPQLDDSADAYTPTVDTHMEATLAIDGEVLGTVNTRYQYQTWGGKRRPERRLTSGLRPLTNVASADDFAIFTFDTDHPNWVSIDLVTSKSERYLDISSEIGKSRWGVLSDNAEAVSNADIIAQAKVIDQIEKAPFHLFAQSATRSKSRQLRYSRDLAFRAKVLKAYQQRCCVTGLALLSPSGSTNLEAAHIVPVRFNGSDDVRNGIALSRDLHWAFDAGLFGVNESRQVYVPSEVRGKSENTSLARLHGKRIREARPASRGASSAAFHWHMSKIVSKKD